MAPARKIAPATAPDHDASPTSIDRLTETLARLCDIIDDLREDFSWVTRNGLPVQPIEHVHVKRMALDPCAGDWGERLEIERSTFPANAPAFTLDTAALDRIAESLTTTVEAVAQGQLEAVLNALDAVRHEILSAVGQQPDDPPAAAAPSPPSVSPPPENRPRGSLF